MKTLLIIDMQNDFLPNGSLEVKNGDRIIPVINNLLDKFDLIAATQDWHPKEHKSFAANHEGQSPFEIITLHGIEQILWPDHCVQGTWGAEFHSALEIKPISTIFRKGMDIERDSYSGFYDNHCEEGTGLAGYLRDNEATDLYFCGLCADICVYYSIKDAIREGFNCWLIEDATCPLNEADYLKIKAELLEKGVRFIKSADIY